MAAAFLLDLAFILILGYVIFRNLVISISMYINFPEDLFMYEMFMNIIGILCVIYLAVVLLG